MEVLERERGRVVDEVGRVRANGRGYREKKRERVKWRKWEEGGAVGQSCKRRRQWQRLAWK